ncbi:MAG TPA: ATP-binding cassette domain-containing protein [Candidatus Omnitrophota bacterium]|nr:ATP-binding cassette domain-containing protein [Candidatus Omnitrophota bacterium]
MLLRIQNLKKYFYKGSGLFTASRVHVKAVDGVSLDVHAGQHVGLVGESGSGKSTLARLIVRLYEPEEGTVIWDGRGGFCKKRSHDARRDVQMVFQDPYSSLDPRFTVRRILLEALSLCGEKISPKEQTGRMQSVLASVGLEEGALGRFPHEFSGGERQRVAIARALLMKPRLLILDEAVSSLDVLVQQQIVELLLQLQKDYSLTYLFITHNLKIVRKLCKRIAVMYRGKIVETAETDELFKNPLHPYTQRLLAAAMDYRVHETAWIENFTEKFQLIDKGNSHFVLE